MLTNSEQTPVQHFWTLACSTLVSATPNTKDTLAISHFNLLVLPSRHDDQDNDSIKQGVESGCNRSLENHHQLKNVIFLQD
jgi:hypothetical protein